MKHITLFLALFLFQYFNGCTKENEFTATQIEGTINQADNSPLTGVTVELTIGANTYLAETDENGFYSFTNIEPGLGFISFKKLENIVYEERIAAYEGKSQEHHFTINQQAEDAFIRLINNSLEISNQEQSVTLQLESNISYTISCNSNWITWEDKVYQSFEPLSVRIADNETFEERTAEITITTQNRETRLVTIKQNTGPPLKLLDSENLADATAFFHKGVIFHFSQPVQFIRIENTHRTAIDELKVTEINEGKSIHVSNFPFLLFEKADYKLTVEDRNGNELTIDFCQKLYQGELISKSRGEFLLTSNNTCGWMTGNPGYIVSLPEMRTIKQLTDVSNYDHWSYNIQNETVNAVTKTADGSYKIDIYKANTGQLIETSIFQLPENNHLSQITYAGNGVGLFTTNNQIFTINTELKFPPFIGYKTEPNSGSKSLAPYVESCFNGEGFILHGSNPVNHVTWVDASTLEAKKIVDAPNDLLCVAGKQSPFIALGNGNEVRLIHIHELSEKKFHSPGSFYEMVLIENKQEVSNLLLFSDHCIYVINCLNGSSRKIEVPYPNFHCTSMQTIGKYLILSRYDQNDGRYYNYLYNTSLFYL